MADNGWIYRYDFDNGDCYVGKEGSFDPFIRAAEHLQDALAVLYPEKYTGFKALFRSTNATYTAINRYDRNKVQNFAWQWALDYKNNNEGIKSTHQGIEDERKRIIKESTGTGVSHIYWAKWNNGQKDIFKEDKKKFKNKKATDFQKALDRGIYKYMGEGPSVSHYDHLPDPTGDYADLLGKITSWKYISVEDMRKIFQVTPTEIDQLVKANQNEDKSWKTINLTPILNILFGKEINSETHQRSKTNDWINIFYTEVRKSGKTGGRAGASLLDVCEMFATLNAYYQLGTSKVVNSGGQSPEMLNSEIMMASFSSLLAGKQQAIQQTITQSKNLQNQLAQDPDFLKDIIAQLSKEGNKAGKNVKDLYKASSSEIANIIAERIKNTNIWSNKGEEQKTEMFKKVFALLTSDTFSRIGNKGRTDYLPIN